MKSRFKEICISSEKLTVDLDYFLKVAANKIEKWAYIIHDKNAAKPHYHIILDFGKNLVKDEVVTDLLKIDRRYICTRRAASWNEYLRYLLHTHDYEYPATQIVTNLDFKA